LGGFSEFLRERSIGKAFRTTFFVFFIFYVREDKTSVRLMETYEKATKLLHKLLLYTQVQKEQISFNEKKKKKIKKPTYSKLLHRHSASSEKLCKYYFQLLTFAF